MSDFVKSEREELPTEKEVLNTGELAGGVVKYIHVVSYTYEVGEKK